VISVFEENEDKKQYMELLLIGDEQEDMITKYLFCGRLFVMRDDEKVLAVCVVKDEGNGRLEIKNIAVSPDSQRKGYGRKMLSFIENKFSGSFRSLFLGTGDSPLTVPFYESCGFRRSGAIKNFFIDNYDHPIIEAGVQLCDMICFEKELPDNYGTVSEGITEI